jgi:transposase
MDMSEREWRTLNLIERVIECEISVSEAAASLGRSVRQVQRMRKRVLAEGAAAVQHGNRGRSPKHKLAEADRERIIELAKDKYAGFNDHHLHEKLVTDENFSLSRETVRRVRRAAGQKSPRKRRPPKHLRRRERSAQAGMMILWDGSTHDWLEGRGPRLCLMGAVDDATGELLPGAHFAKQESTVGYLRLLRDVVVNKGIPQTAYGDRHSSLRRNDKHWSLEEELAGEREKTHVGIALEELGVRVIFARSPQAKGRVERAWNTLQDRLVSELRLANAKTRGQANGVLEKFRKDYNSRFMKPPRNPTPAWGKAPNDRTRILDLCALRYIRKVRKNNTIQVNKTVIDIPKPRSGRTYAGRQVEVRHHLNGHYRVFCDGECIAWRREGPRPKESTVTGPRTELGLEKRQRRTRERKLREQREQRGQQDDR